MTSLKSQFLLDPDVKFLNHGSFGATPRPVFDTYQAWQRRLERQPVAFLGREIRGHLRQAREALAAYLHAEADDVVYVPNATFALNVVARSLELDPGDEVLTSNHEYGACDNVWRYLAGKRGFDYRVQNVPLPVSEVGTLVEQFWTGVTTRTRVIYLSHITSPTALRLPIEAICARARQAGIMTVIDGAHAPGQIDLDLPAIAADFYFGNAHKWLMSPKGAAFLYTRRERQHLVEPLVVGWGWSQDPAHSAGSRYLDVLQRLGTNDLAAYLSVPAAIEFQRAHNWREVRRNCRALARQALERIGELTGCPPPYAPDSEFFCQMASAPLPAGVDVDELQKQLYDEYHIEVPCFEWHDWRFIRVSVQGYNSQSDIDALLTALARFL